MSKRSRPQSHNPKNPKEVVSVSIPSSTVEMLDIASSFLDFDNKSKLVDKAIKEYIFRKLASNPIVWGRLYKEIMDVAC